MRTVELELEAPLAALNLSTPVRDPRKHHQLPMPPPDGCSSPYPIPSCPPLRASCFCNGFNYRHGPICSVESINPPLPPSFAKGFPDAEQALPSNPIVPNPQDVTKPSDIDILERAMTTKTPVLIIISRSSPLLPFNLSNNCAYSFLGYWIIHEMDVCLLLMFILSDLKMPTVGTSRRVAYEHCWGDVAVEAELGVGRGGVSRRRGESFEALVDAHRY